MRAGWPLLLFFGCEDPAAEALIGQAPPPLVLQVGEALAGQPLALRVDGAAPGQQVRFVRGQAPGAGPCPGLLQGACLGVLAPAVIGTATADAGGVAVWELELAMGLAVGAELVFQAVQVRPAAQGLVSNAAVAEVVHPDDACDSSGLGWDPAAAAWECEVLVAVNAARAVGGDCGPQGVFGPTHPLVMHEAAQLAARVHVEWMVENQTFSHASPGGPLGATLGARMTGAGYTPWRSVAENLQRGANNPTALVNYWLGSPGHCANLLDPGKRDAGVGHVVAPNGTPYWGMTIGRLF